MTTSDYDDEDGQTTSSGGSHSAPRPIPPILSSDDDSASETPSWDTDAAPPASEAPDAPEAASSPDAGDDQRTPESTEPDSGSGSGSTPYPGSDSAPQAPSASTPSASPARRSAFGSSRSTEAGSETPGESSPLGAGSSDPTATQAWSGAAVASGTAGAAGAASASGASGTTTSGEQPVTPQDPNSVGPTKPTTAGLGARTATMPVASGAGGAGVGSAASGESEASTTVRPPLEEDSWLEGPRSRVAAHIWGTVVTLILVPLTWLLLTDGAMRTYYSLADGASSPNMAGVLSLAGGLVGLLILALIARASSIGGWVWGGLLAAWGVVPLVIPVQFTDWIGAIHGPLTSLHQDFGQNVHDYILASGRSGLMLTLGVVIMLFALVSHTARRSGREEGRLKEALAQRDRAH